MAAHGCCPVISFSHRTVNSFPNTVQCKLLFCVPNICHRNLRLAKIDKICARNCYIEYLSGEVDVMHLNTNKASLRNRRYVCSLIRRSDKTGNCLVLITQSIILFSFMAAVWCSCKDAHIVLSYDANRLLRSQRNPVICKLESGKTKKKSKLI